MHFFTIATLFVAGALAVPAPGVSSGVAREAAAEAAPLSNPGTFERREAAAEAAAEAAPGASDDPRSVAARDSDAAAKGSAHGADLSPKVYENVDISGFYIRQYTESGVISHVSFNLTGNEAKDVVCTIDSPILPTKTTACGSSKYSFSLVQTKLHEVGVVDIQIFHQTGTIVGLWAQVPEPPVTCYNTGFDVNELLCSQKNAYTVVLTPDGTGK
ncbi:hypothetical protein ACEQ8H_002612 [Pleosporales sp. CAS-2024a]